VTRTVAYHETQPHWQIHLNNYSVQLQSGMTLVEVSHELL